jgi:ActR/RegA family two-component response regulator
MLQTASGAESRPPAADDTEQIAGDWPSLEKLSLRYIAAVIERNGGNNSRAADMLGIDRRTLARILARERAKAAARARHRELARTAKRPGGGD